MFRTTNCFDCLFGDLAKVFIMSKLKIDTLATFQMKNKMYVKQLNAFS